MNRFEWMRGEIAEWRKEGLVDEATANRLSERYTVDAKRLSVGAVLAGSIGALLIGLGIIALFAANWDCFGRGARALIAMSPVAVCGAVALWASFKGWCTMSLWEPLGILWFISVIAASCLVAQTYQVGGLVPELVLFVAVLTLSVVWTTRSVGAMSAWLVLPIVWMFSEMGVHAEDNIATGIEGLLIMVASIPAYVAFLRRNPPRAALVAGQLATGIAYSFGAGLIIVGTFLLHMRTESWYVPVFWICSALLAAVAIALKLPVWPKIALSVALFAAIPSPWMDFGVYLVALALAAAVAAYGIAKARLSHMNSGVSLLLWLILVKFFESRMGFTVKGLVLIGAGIVLAALNVVLVRAKKRRAE